MMRRKHSLAIVTKDAKYAKLIRFRCAAARARRRSPRGFVFLVVIAIVAVAAIIAYGLYGGADAIIESRCEAKRNCEWLAANYSVKSLTYAPSTPMDGCPLTFSSEQCFDLVEIKKCRGLPGSWYDFVHFEETKTIWVDTTLTVTGPESFTSTKTNVVVGANRCTTVTFDPIYPVGGDYNAEVTIEIVSEWPDSDSKASGVIGSEWTADTAGEECDLAVSADEAAFPDLWKTDPATGDSYAALGQDNVQGVQFNVQCPCPCVACDPGLGHKGLDLKVYGFFVSKALKNVAVWAVALDWDECTAPSEVLQYQQSIEIKNLTTGEVITVDPTEHAIETGVATQDSYDFNSFAAGSYEMTIAVALISGSECDPAGAVGLDGCEAIADLHTNNSLTATVDR